LRKISFDLFRLPWYLEEIIIEVIYKVKIIIIIDMQAKNGYSDNKNRKYFMGCVAVKNKHIVIKVIICNSQDFINLA